MLNITIWATATVAKLEGQVFNPPTTTTTNICLSFTMDQRTKEAMTVRQDVVEVAAT